MKTTRKSERNRSRRSSRRRRVVYFNFTSNEWLHFVCFYLLCYGTNPTIPHCYSLPNFESNHFLIFLLLILLLFCRHKSIIWLKKYYKSIHRTTWHDSKSLLLCDNISLLLLLFASLLLVNIPNFNMTSTNATFFLKFISTLINE